MNGLPASAECRTILADGSVVRVTATRRARAGRADVKCDIKGAPAMGERMQQVLRLARHTEARIDSRDQVVVSMERAPQAHERDWELAAVLADRMVRGLVCPQQATLANGWSDAWQLGQVRGHDLIAAPHVLTPLLGGPDGLTHLGALNGHSDPGAAVSSARAWFPLHSGGMHDRLCWVEVSVHPILPEGVDEEDTIAVLGLDLGAALAVRRALVGARHFDGRGLGRWRSVVRFEQDQFHGDSYELALVMADRLARGRELPARGRLIATGCSSAWHAGRVDNVQGLEPKCVLMLAEAMPGDRLLLPGAWAAALVPEFGPALAARQASFACVDTLGLI